MPTITISSPPLPVSRRRAIALRITRWLTNQDVDAAHVVVRFDTEEEASVFSGGMSLESLPHGGEGLRYASVLCCVGTDRNEEFRSGLATCIAETMELSGDTPFFYLEFRPTSTADVYLGAGGRLRRADGKSLAQID